jgi:uncharacterized protein YdeI (YjbR/CyaY-like superfamily)
MEPEFFTTPAELRTWFERHHESEPELLIGYYKKNAGKTGIKHSEAVEQALCFGWIDSVGRRIDDERYQVRFTPRRTGSVWSSVNIAKIAELTEQGLMHQAGTRAYEGRRPDRVATYSYEQPEGAVLDADQAARFAADPEAWAWFGRQPSSYRRAAAHWVISAKRPETRERRLAQLIADSRAGRPVPPLTRR